MALGLTLALGAQAQPAAPIAVAAPAAVPLSDLPYSPSLDLKSLDTQAAPCEDFYRFACGGWQNNNPIPGDQGSWSVYGKLGEDNLLFLWGLAQAAASKTAERSAVEQKTGDYFAACMDESAVEAAGTQPLRPALDAIAALADVRSLAGLVGWMHQHGVDNALFRLGADQDFANSDQMIAVTDAGGLGLPERDYYLRNDAKSKALRADYRLHIARMFELLGDAPAVARAAADAVLKLETQMARASLSVEARRDPYKTHHKMSAAQLAALAPNFDWKAYFQSLKLDASSGINGSINVVEPAFFRRMNALLQSEPLRTWKAYLRWHAVHASAAYLAPPLVQAHFDFYSTKLEGVTTMPARWKKCVTLVDRDVGEALGQLFTQRTFTPQTKQAAAEMTQAIEVAMRQRLQALDWMSPATKKAAFEKLDTVVKKIGYPETWRDYAGLDVQRNDFFGNVRRSQTFEARRQLDKIGKPVDRSEWGMTPPTVNAYYSAQMNDINFPAGILQPPLFDPKMDHAPNYGNTGATIGHELTHGFDDEGSKFDAKGNLRDWWTKKDAQEFQRRTRCVANQYSGYTVVDDVKINGKLTLGEDVADLGGTILAYVAWKTTTAGQKLDAIDGYSPDQRFFIGMAQWACSNSRPETERLQALTDPHSPPKYRINGVVANMPEFAKAFSCKAGQPMVNAKV